MDFSKYDPMQRKTKTPPFEAPARDPEKGFTAADYDNHRRAPGGTIGRTSPGPDTDDLDQPAAVHAPWMESAPLIRLVEYLQKYHDHGATIHARGAETLWISFRPGVTAADMGNGRGQIANNMIGLLQQAAPDMRAMIKENVAIPLIIHHQPKAKVQ